ncbi:glycosyltransferase [Patescibacteria group bacterium]|nr:glycosyltransferase [Patescibacteria group bacterium]
MKPIDVIIVNYNSTDHLLRCLRSIFDAARGVTLEVLVQDNDSRDNVDRVSRLFPQVRLTKNDRNLGFARAINRALEKSFSPYVLILNPDTIVQDGFFETVMEYMDAHGEAGIIGPRILDTDGAVQGSARLFPNLLTALFGRKSLLTKILPDNPITRENILTGRSDGVTPMEVDWVSGACMVVRREAVEDVGAMDARFFMYWEDADWCRRMWQRGWKVIYFPRPSVIHYVGVSSEKNVFRSVVSFHRSIYRLFKKHAKKPHSFLKPIVYWGLIYRLVFVLTSQLTGKLFRILAKHPYYRVAIGAFQSDERIKIVRFIARLNIGGPSIHVHLLTNGLDEKKFGSTLVTGKISPQEGDMSYLFDDSTKSKPIIIGELQREISPAMDIKAFFQILRILRQKDPDIVHTHTAKAGTSARIAVMMHNLFRGKNIQMVHTFHGHVFEGYFSPVKSLMFIWIERLLAMSTDVIISISTTQKEDLSEKFRIAPAAKIKTIPLGFDLKPFLRNDALKGKFRSSLGISDDTLLVGIVGRLVPVKQHVIFLDAAKIFLDQNPGIMVQFVVVGDGELREDLERYADRKGLSEHIRFCGWRRDLPEVYADVDILSLTSVNEGTPVSIIEAMAASTPVIATDAGGVFDLLGSQDGHPTSKGFMVCERGILCKKGDALGFAEGLEYLIKMDAHKREELVREARTFVEHAFSEKRLLRDIESLYLELIEKNRIIALPFKESF